MKYFIFVTSLLIANVATAGSAASLFMQDGMNLEDIQRRLTDKVNGSGLTITHYSNNFRTIYHLGVKKFRDITFHFKDAEGHGRKANCLATFDVFDRDVLIYDCDVDATGWFAPHLKDFQYGDETGTFVFEGIRSSNDAGFVKGKKGQK